MQLTVTRAGHGFREGAWVFTDVSFTAVGGQIVALTGPSGSGKSTLLAALFGTLPLRVGTLEPSGISTRILLPQQLHGVPQRTALDHVALPAMARGAPRERAALAAVRSMRRFGLGPLARLPYSALSGGQAQRLALARGLMTDPDLLLLDEPTGQLDRANAHEVIEVIRETAAANRIVIVATHDDALAHRADLVVHMTTP